MEYISVYREPRTPFTLLQDPVYITAIHQKLLVNRNILVGPHRNKYEPKLDNNATTQDYYYQIP